MLYLVGLGLGDAKDITLRGLEIVKEAERVYLEAYTSLLTVNKSQLEEFYQRSIILADREMVEQNADEILVDADTKTIAFLVVGDPLGATTHSDLIIRAAENNIQYQVIHNASIINAIGCCGLQLYNYGETVSIPFWTETWKPDSFVDRIERNLSKDIKVKELSLEYMMKGKEVYEPPRFMTISQAASQLLQVIESRQQEDRPLTCFSLDIRTVGVARVGATDQVIAVSSLKNIGEWDFGGPLHSLVIVGETHPLEDRMLTIVSNAKKL